MAAPGVVLLGDRRFADELADAGVTVAPVTSAADVDAAVAALRADGSSAVFVLGVGASARDAFLQGSREDVAGVIGIDGSPPVEEARAGRIRTPVVAVYAGDAADDAKAFAEALAGAGVLQETVVYDDVEPGFVERGTPREACDDAWRLARRFMGVAGRR